MVGQAGGGFLRRTPHSLKIALKNRYGEKKTKKITLAKIETFLKNQEPYSLHRNARRKSSRNRIYTPRVGLQLSADLIDMKRYKDYNEDNVFILVIQDMFSRLVHAAIPLKNKQSKSVLGAFQEVFRTSKLIAQFDYRSLYSDFGGEFDSAIFRKWLKSKKIALVLGHAVGGIHNAIIERTNRTLMETLHQWFEQGRQRRWIDILPTLVQSYNHTYHRAIKMAPADVTVANDHLVHDNLYGKDFYKKLSKGLRRESAKFKVGDLVRVSQELETFTKAHEGRWSRTLFRIEAGPFYSALKELPMYYLADLQGQRLVNAKFYEYELQRVNEKTFLTDFIHPYEVVHIESDGRRLVRWLGYPKKFNSHLPAERKRKKKR